MKHLLIITILFFSQVRTNAQNGNVLYDNSIVHTLDIVSSYPGSLIDSLSFRHTNERMLGLEWSYMQVKGYFDGFLVDSIGLRMKGGDVSVSTIKPSLKIDVNEFVSGKRYDGLKKINVDNCLYDPSLMREKLYYDMGNELGFPCSRTSFVKVTIDGVFYGNYTYIEQVNKQFLKRYFGNKDGNLYKAGGWAPGVPNGSFVLKTNEILNDRSDIDLFFDKVNNTPATYYKDTISKYINVESVLNYLALATFTVYSDNLMGNNGYLYHNTTTNLFEMIPWDIDYSFMNSTFSGYQYTASNTELINPIMINGFFQKIIAVPDYEALYFDKICFINSHLGHQDSLIAKIDFYKSILQNASITPDVNCDYTSFSDPSNPFIMGANFLGLKDFAGKRHLKVSQELNLVNVTCENTIGVNQIIDDETFKIYPNPASKYIYIESEQSINDVIIYNSMGKKVKEIKYSKPEINIENLTSGMYFIQIKQSNNKVRTNKILVD